MGENELGAEYQRLMRPPGSMAADNIFGNGIFGNGRLRDPITRYWVRLVPQ
jgi:hypothetical protein